MMVARENAQTLIAVYLRQLALGIVKKTDNILPFRKKRAVPDVCNAVSYTHLDVYKRQVRTSATRCAIPPESCAG